MFPIYDYIDVSNLNHIRPPNAHQSHSWEHNKIISNTANMSVLLKMM